MVKFLAVGCLVSGSIVLFGSSWLASNMTNTGVQTSIVTVFDLGTVFPE